MTASFEGLHEPVLEVLKNNEAAFRAGVVETGAGKRPFDAEYIAGRLSQGRGKFARSTVARVLEHLAEDPTNHIVLNFASDDNPSVMHIDSWVLWCIEQYTDALLVGWAMTEEEVGGVATFVYNTFDAAFIAQRLGLNANFVACALRRLVGDPKNFLGLINANSDNPAPIRDYGASRDTKYAAAVR